MTTDPTAGLCDIADELDNEMFSRSYGDTLRAAGAELTRLRLALATAEAENERLMSHINSLPAYVDRVHE